jgi:protein SCO1
MSRKSLLYTAFFVVLTAVFYVIVKKWIVRDNSISSTTAFSFTNQDGRQVTQKDVAGKVYVAEYFFTTCKGICPKMNNHMKLVYEKLKNEKDFLILSHTCDPDTDSAGQLKKYADSMGVNTQKWIFLTGDKKQLYDIARVSYTIDDPKNNVTSIEDDFLHTQFWALVDKKGDVVKIYDGLKESEVQELIKDAEKLLSK